MVKKADRGAKRSGVKPLATAEDAEIGRRVRAIRIEREITQKDLAQRLGIAFQQIQKYEKGVNRIGGGRLQKLSEILEVPVSAFFPEQNQNESRSTLFDLSHSPGAVELLRAYNNLPHPQFKRSLVDLANGMVALANQQQTDSERD
jgi:transcriptional regulator with XRE-family HTH domain